MKHTDFFFLKIVDGDINKMHTLVEIIMIPLVYQYLWVAEAVHRAETFSPEIAI